MSFNILHIFYMLIILSSLFMILSNNPVYSVLFLIAIFINVSIIFIILNIDFIGIILLLVYVGAIAILFLFIVMMLNIKKLDNEQNTHFIIGAVLFFVFFLHYTYFFFYVFVHYIDNYLIVNTTEFLFDLFISDEYNNIYVVKKIGVFIFTKYYICLFFSGVLLLVSLVGSIYLTNFKKGYSTKSQYNQCFRKSNLINTHLF